MALRHKTQNDLSSSFGDSLRSLLDLKRPSLNVHLCREATSGSNICFWPVVAYRARQLWVGSSLLDGSKRLSRSRLLRRLPENFLAVVQQERQMVFGELSATYLHVGSDA